MADGDLKPPEHNSEESTIDSRPSNVLTLEKIADGLSIKVGERTISTFTYGYVGDLKPVNWKRIVADDEHIVGEHIRCLPLKEGQDLTQRIEHFLSFHARAIVVVNNRDDFVVKAQQWPQGSAIPVFLLKATAGSQLLSIVHDHNDVFAKVEVESQVDMDPAASAEPDKKSKGRFEKIRSWLPGGGERHDFKAQVIELMFNLDIPTIVSADSVIFTAVMAAFQQYESAVRADGSHGDLLKKLVKFMKSTSTDVFERDFPFYIILAHRIRLNDLYKCEESQVFLSTCVDKLETMEPSILSSTLNAFLQREDFFVLFGTKDSCSSVCILLKSACLKLALMSSKRQNKQSVGKLPEHFLYTRMIWVIIAIKCHLKVEAGTASVGDIWNEYIVQMGKELMFTPETIDDFRRGLNLTKQLNLPATAMMNFEQLSKLSGVIPLSYLTNYLDCVAGFVSKKADIWHLITDLRAQYHFWISDDKLPSKLTALSIDGTIAGAIQEGITFVGQLQEIYRLQEEMDEELCSAEELGWLTTLLLLVDVTQPGAEVHLKKFFTKGKILNKHRTKLTEIVIERTRKSLPLPIHLFYPLYKQLWIWPNMFLEDYLSTYKISPGVKICDGTWNEFISAVTNRFSGAHNHHYLVGFIKNVGDQYTKNEQSLDFIIDLLRINVPNLLGLPEKTNTGHHKAVEIQHDFSTYVLTYIHQNALKNGLLQSLNKILPIISEHQDEFQQLLVTVLHKEVIPELKTIQTRDGLEVLATACTKLWKSISWTESLNVLQQFCWGIVGTFCLKTLFYIRADTLDWINTHNFIIQQLSQIYATYCKEKMHGQTEIVLHSLPQDIACLPNDDVHRFFDWVRTLQQVLFEWKKKIQQHNCNYDDILFYASNLSNLIQIGQFICARSAIVDSKDILHLKNNYLELFEKINSHFIKYIPGKPDAKYCTLPQILRQYGISLPTQFTKHLILPGEESSQSGENMLVNQHSPNTSGTFQPPGLNVSLRATKGLTLNELEVLAIQLDEYVNPILDHMHVLVFFTLYQSQIFNNHVLQTKNMLSVKQAASTVHVFLSTCQILGVGINVVDESLKVLANAMDTTRKLLVKLMDGTVKYSEIIIEGGKLKLESINIQAEFNTLTSFFDTMESAPQIKCHEGLNGILCMLELFQYTSVHIPIIHSVCEQCKLQACLNDSVLTKLVKLATKIEGSRGDLMPLEAVEEIHRVKFSLCVNTPEACQKLGLFPVVSNSSAFLQFLKEKNFGGEDGQKLFNQQYQLITGQLQHEEYNETVLNHLYAAYTIILPFLDTKQDFKSLMSKVTGLDISGGLEQLQTVNSNISLIHLWFSRAEGNTLKNVVQDLECIIETGYFQFEFMSSEGIDISLLYSPDSVLHTEPSGPSWRPQALNQKGSGKKRWSKDQIDDFVRQLGFFDAETGGDNIKHFLHLSETAIYMLKLYTQLRDFGCADFTKGAKCITLLCNTKDTEPLVQDVEAKLSSWKDERLKLCDQNDWMLFFHTPKMLLLYSFIRNWASLTDAIDLHYMGGKLQDISWHIEGDLKHELQVHSLNNSSQFQELSKELSCIVGWIVQEISFMGRNDPQAFEVMKNKVEIILQQQHHDLMACQTPMHTISMFLSTLLQNHSLPIKTVANMSENCSQVMHYYPGFSQKELIPLILSIFGEFPKPFQILRCQSSSTLEELHLFLQRAAKFNIMHLLLEVNKLPIHLQEHLIRSQSGNIQANLQYVETKSSNLQHMPWITLKDLKEDLICPEVPHNILAQSPVHVHLIYGNAGDGKTHYIKRKLNFCSACCSISVNESFTPIGAIKKLRQLPTNQPNCAVFFNFTLLPRGKLSCPQHNTSKGPNCEDAGYILYRQLIEAIGWFFFDLLILGYVEDKDTGLSFQLPIGLGWVIYVEVPSRELLMNPHDMLKHFCDDIPTLGLLGAPHLIPSDTPFIIDDDAQLVCKYLKAYKEKRIDRLFKQNLKVLVKFSSDPTVTDDECHALLTEYMSEHIRTRKITQHLFIKYMSIRCQFLDRCPAFNYNQGVGEIDNCKGIRTDTTALGSSLMDTMLNEVSDFCNPAIKENWSCHPHQQLIYDIKDGGGSFGLITLNAGMVSQADRDKFSKIGVNVPHMTEMHSRNLLDKYLSRALNVELIDGRLKPVDDAGYVLTLDYALKMLSIHERYRCGEPVVIEGETGVGKTALVQMLSVLWNNSHLGSWNKKKGKINDILAQRIGDLSDNSYHHYGKCVQLAGHLSEEKPITYEDMLLLCNLPGSSQSPAVLYTILRQHLLDMMHLPVLKLLVTKDKDDMTTLFKEAETQNTAETTAKLLQAVYYAQLQPTFYKLNIHAALTPSEIHELLGNAFDQARKLKNTQYSSEMCPCVTVFFDEVNTSSCPGLLKEIIVDRTFEGVPIPENVFVVAACNPHRGNSLASHEQNEEDKWMRGSYYVHPLHPTLQLLKWDYGSLDTYQERDYINAKIKMLHWSTLNIEEASFTELIAESQEQMRCYASQQLRSYLSEKESKVVSRSCVSQRDIQRVFTLHAWLIKSYFAELSKSGGNHTDCNRRALLVALFVVYFMRLNAKFREQYRWIMDKKCTIANEVNFSNAVKDVLEWYIDRIELPRGIAKTEALKENIFAIIICTVTQIPLIIVGAPGSSKTLSFNITVANLKGQESKAPLFRQTDKYPSLDPHYYQCSRRTTSNEIQTVFSRAINRQKSHLEVSLRINCVVFMDEAGLPEESHESLKVLHYYLDNPEVSFVAITNHVLDAAKTNRAITLFRPESSADDLLTLAKGCLYSHQDDPQPNQNDKDFAAIAYFCTQYLDFMKDKNIKQFFGLRDFIYFVNYLRRKRKLPNTLDAHVVLEALERNFNGSDEFKAIYKNFLAYFEVDNQLERIHERHLLSILRDSLADGTYNNENEVRYKLIIDPSEDESLVRLLFTFGVLDRQKTRVFVCSDFPGDTNLQKINTIAAILHSAIEGHTVVMAQTDSIHESFYDLFNQRFRRIDDSHGSRYYANIAIGAHSKPCRIHPEFQCVVVVKQSDLGITPAPFLNRFEKYRLTHQALYEESLSYLPSSLAIVIRTVKQKITDFVQTVGEQSFYGLKKETVDSLLTTMLPTKGHTFHAYQSKIDQTSTCESDIGVICLQELIHAFQTSAGFYLFTSSLDELKQDAHYISHFVQADPEFHGLLAKIGPQEVASAVAEAVQKLHEAPAPQGNNITIDVSPEACMMVEIAIQWLIMHLCKRLVQLMTPEALVIHRNKISSSYVNSYVDFQSHFSLKSWVHHHVTALRSATKYCPTKLICYSRSSPSIHKLPLLYDSLVKCEESTCETIKELVCDDTTAVMVYKLSNTPQKSVRERISIYLESTTAQVLLLVANMAEVTLPMINHLRIMIEEAENRHLTNQIHHNIPLKPKLFLLLVHFPPSKFLYPCYPALYLRGWDHFYLDTIGHQKESATIDVENWLSHCSSVVSTKDDSLLQVTEGFIDHAIPVVASRLPFSHNRGFPFSGELTVSKRNLLLEKLLVTKKVGSILCKLFRSYWRPNVMIGYLEQAARLALQQQSTLNITDTIQAGLKAIFMDFMVVMVSRMNENCNIDCLFVGEESEAVDQLFRDLLALSPLPPLEQLKALSNNLQPSRSQGYIPVFPFFHVVLRHMDTLVEHCKRDINERVNVLESVTRVHNQPHDLTSELCNTTSGLLSVFDEHTKDNSKGYVAVSVQACADCNNDHLWTRYYTNFVFSKLHFTSLESAIEKQIIHELFGDIQFSEIKLRILYLHSYMAIYQQLDLVKLATTLQSLSIIHQMKFILSSLSSTPLTDSHNSCHQSYSDHDHLNLSTYIVHVLFTTLAWCMNGDLSQTDAIQQLELWYSAYLNIITLPSFAEKLGTGLVHEAKSDKVSDVELTRAQLNVMKTMVVFIQFMQCCSQDVFEMGQKIFSTLFTKHFMQIGQCCKYPQLSDMVWVATKYCFVTSPAEGGHQMDKFIYKLLGQFFPIESTTYSSDDCQTFLSYANSQNHWLTINTVPAEHKMSIYNCMLYLSRILCTKRENTTDNDSLALYNSNFRTLVGEVLMAAPELGPPTYYIPLFYQQTSFIFLEQTAIAQRMQQPLAHLYFLTLMEHLQDMQHKLADIFRIYSKILQKCDQSTVLDQEKVLLYIELQAVAQVIFQKVANSLDPSKPDEMQQLRLVLTDVNALLEDTRMGGGACRGHSHVLALHILKHLNSYKRFTELLTTQFDAVCISISCLKQFSEDLQCPKQSEVFKTLRSLCKQYPKFPTENNFINAILSTGGKAGELSILTQFVTQRAQLEAGGHLLPDLVEFYLWLHNHLAYVVSKEKAAELKVGQVIDKAVARYTIDLGKRVKDLYERVKARYNSYIHASTITHHVHAEAAAWSESGNKVCTINDDTALLHLLSEEEQSNGWLYAVIVDIVDNHNSLIEGLYASKYLDRLLPTEPSKLPLTEFLPCHCIIGKNRSEHISDFIQLVHSHYCHKTAAPPEDSHSFIERGDMAESLLDQVQNECQFDLYLLQEDIVTTYLAGKPLLESAASIRIPFQFRSKDQQKPSPHPLDVACSGCDIDTLMEQLPDSLKAACDDSTVKTFEYEFHPASYMTLLEAMQVMKNVLGHLINYSKEHKEQSLPATQTLLQFMKQLEIPVFTSASTQKLSSPQQRFLEKIPIPIVFSCLQLLIQWLKDGMYDFCMLPFALKAHLPKEDENALSEIPTRWKTDPKVLLCGLESLTDILAHSETHFTKLDNEALQTSMNSFFVDFFSAEDGVILTFIPNTIHLQHYVAFNVALRHLIAILKKTCLSSTDDAVNGWTEHVHDIWTRHLPHFRGVHGSGGKIIPRTGFEEESDTDNDGGLQDDLNKLPIEKPANSDKETVDISAEQLQNEASKYSVDQVCEFLSSINMNQYAEDLRNEDIDGGQLFTADERELEGYGISSPLHCFMVKFLFNRKLLHKYPKHPITVVHNFLHEFKLDHYTEGFIAQEMDGDMLLEILKKGNKHILAELGVQSAMDVLKFKAKFKVYIEPSLLMPLEKSAHSYSVSDMVDFFKGIKMDAYTDNVQTLNLDGDMLLAADDGELEEVLEVKSPLHRFKIKYLFRRHLEGNSTASQSPISPEIETLVPKCAQEGIDEGMLQSIVKLDDCDTILKQLGAVAKNRDKIKKFYNAH